jgi:hypothetical protein
VKPAFIGGCCFFSGFFTQSPQKTKNMYNPNRLSGIRRVTLITKTPQNFVWSCQTASELLISVIRLLLLSPRAKTTEHFAGFFLLARPYSTRQQRICMDGLEENTDIRTHPLYCRPALVKRLVKHLVHRWKQGQMYKRINSSSALGRFCF